MSVAYDLAEKLLQINAIQLRPQNPFTWASGLKSPIYCDNRISLSYPEVRNFIKDSLTELAQEFRPFDAIVGVATAGIPHGALLADALNLPFAYIRSKSKEHGMQNALEGFLPKSSSVLVIEDLVSTGGSSLKAIEKLSHLEIKVSGLAALFTYGLNTSKSAFSHHKVKFESLSNFEALLEVASQNSLLDKKDIEILREWQEDPSLWSENYMLKSK